MNNPNSNHDSNSNPNTVNSSIFNSSQKPKGTALNILQNYTIYNNLPLINSNNKQKRM